MKSYEERIAKLEWELEDIWACRSTNLAQFTEEIKAKEEEAPAREIGAYVNSYSDLLAELMKRYPEEEFSWMEKLIPGAEDESEEEPEREERENVEIKNVTEEQVREDPPVE